MIRDTKFQTILSVTNNKNRIKKTNDCSLKIQTQIYDYFANKSKHKLIIKNKHKNIAIYLKNRKKSHPKFIIYFFPNNFD